METALTPDPSPLTPDPSPLTGEGDAGIPASLAANPAADLLAFLRAAGFTVSATDGKVYVTPRDRLSPAECSQIVALKAGLLAVLAEERWVRCQTCLHSVDGGMPEDVWRFCGVQVCPYRGRGPR